jgi:hypothetical protein
MGTKACNGRRGVAYPWGGLGSRGDSGEYRQGIEQIVVGLDLALFVSATRHNLDFSSFRGSMRSGPPFSLRCGRRPSEPKWASKPTWGAALIRPTP